MNVHCDHPAGFGLPSLRFSRRVDPRGDVESWRLEIPAKPACYLLADEGGRPVLLATIGSLRPALVRRLGPDDADQTTRKIDYRAVVREVRWREVCSQFEAEWTWLENARQFIPDRYRQLIRRWRGHWVRVEPDARFPRFIAADPPEVGAGITLGPIATAKAARQFVETLEDLFDLCRYHEILVQAPNGDACAYKEMGKCPAPCDGSVSMAHYRGQIRAALDFALQSPNVREAELERRMERASGELAFERAARIKTQLERVRQLRGEAFAWLAPIEKFRFLSLQPGSRKRHVRAFIITPGGIRFMGEMKPRDLDAQVAWLAGRLADAAGAEAPTKLDASARERIALVARHLLRSERQRGEFLRLGEGLSTDQIAAAVDRVQHAERSQLQSMESER